MRRKISKILGYTVQTDEDGKAKYNEAFEKLEVEGRITKRNMILMLREILKWIDENE